MKQTLNEKKKYVTITFPNFSELTISQLLFQLYRLSWYLPDIFTYFKYRRFLPWTWVHERTDKAICLSLKRKWINRPKCNKQYKQHVVDRECKLKQWRDTNVATYSHLPQLNVIPFFMLFSFACSGTFPLLNNWITLFLFLCVSLPKLERKSSLVNKYWEIIIGFSKWKWCISYDLFSHVICNR